MEELILALLRQTEAQRSQQSPNSRQSASTSLPLHAVTCFTFPLFFPLQGSIQQLVIKDDPRVAEEQCEDDDPYVRHSVTCC